MNFLGLFDVDEFVVLQDLEKIPEMLAKVSPQLSVISLPWVYIKGSESDSRDCFTPLVSMGSNISCGTLNYHVKSFVRPEAVELIANNPHYKYHGKGYFKERLDLFIAKKARGTGAVFRDADFGPMHKRIEEFDKNLHGFTCNWYSGNQQLSTFDEAAKWSSRIKDI